MKQGKEYRISPLLFAALITVILTFSVSAYKNQNVSGNIEILTDSADEKISTCQEIESVLSDYDSLLTFELKNSANVGAAAAIIYKNEIVYLKCFGVKQKGGKDSVNEHTIFRLASVSKTVSGMLAGMLFADSVLLPEQKVVEFLPEFRLKNQEQANQLTLVHVLSHTTGMPQHTYDDLVEQKIPQKNILAKLSEVGHASKPGELYAYQNVMFSLFDTIVAVKTGKSYLEILEQRIFTPFGMKDASASFYDFANNPNKAMPHTSGRNGFRLIPLNDRYYNTLAAAGVNASISDMGQFLLAISSKDDDLFSEEARKITFTPQIESILKRSYYRNWGALGTKYYALGWRIIHFKNHTIAQHSGFVQGYQSEIAVCHDSEIGIAVLTNSPNSYTSTYIPAFLSMFFDHQKKTEPKASVNDSVPETFNEEEVSN